MTINKRGGKNHKKGKKVVAHVNTGLTYKDSLQNQEYARVISTLGDCRLSIELLGVDPTSPMSKVTTPLICKIPGAFRKKVFINKGDYILVSVREYQKDHVDVITKYSHNEALTLMKQNEIPMDDRDQVDSENPGFDIIVDDEFNDQPLLTNTTKVTKDDKWYNSLLPPTDSDNEADSDDNGNDKKDKKVNFTLNQKGVKINEDSTANNQIEEIDLETL